MLQQHILGMSLPQWLFVGVILALLFLSLRFLKGGWQAALAVLVLLAKVVPYFEPAIFGGIQNSYSDGFFFGMFFGFAALSPEQGAWSLVRQFIGRRKNNPPLPPPSHRRSGQAFETVAPAPQAASNGQRPRILLAEDEELMASIMDDLLRQRDYEVIKASTISDAVEAYKTNSIDVAIFGVAFEGDQRDGFDLLKRPAKR